VVLTPSHYEKHLQNNENSNDVLNFAANFVVYLCEGLDYALPLSSIETCEHIAKLCKKLNDSNLLGNLSRVALTLLDLQGSLNYKQEMDTILMHDRQVCGIDLSLQLASEFKRFETLTKLVYEGG
jgi:hypothetical protein